MISSVRKFNAGKSQKPLKTPPKVELFVHYNVAIETMTNKATTKPIINQTMKPT
jgi:hypothetical protein